MHFKVGCHHHPKKGEPSSNCDRFFRILTALGYCGASILNELVFLQTSSKSQIYELMSARLVAIEGDRHTDTPPSPRKHSISAPSCTEYAEAAQPYCSLQAILVHFSAKQAALQHHNPAARHALVKAWIELGVPGE